MVTLFKKTLFQICSSGNSDYSYSTTYNCPEPLKGRYVTLQRVQENPSNPGWVMYINEVYVDAVTF